MGVEDKSRRIRGVGNPLDLEERLANLMSDLITPRLVPEIEILTWRRTQVLAVQVYPSPNRPHYLKREGPEGGVDVRVGSTNRRADRDRINELRRSARGETYDSANGIQPASIRRKGMSWETFLKSHWGIIAATDFFNVEALTSVGLIRYAGVGKNKWLVI